MHGHLFFDMAMIRRKHILGLLAVLLALACVASIYSPIRFDNERDVRELAVKRRLVGIRQAEERYRKAHGTYASDFKQLVAGGYLADSLRLIPFSEGKEFSLTVTTQIGKSGRTIPLMECGAMYADYLSGLDENSISNLIEEANEAGKYPGLKIGDITTPNDNAGNWE